MDFLFLLLLCISAYQVRFSGFRGLYEDYLSVKSTESLRGICAVYVILYHLSYEVTSGHSLFLFLRLPLSLACISVFLFLSGYGTMHQYLAKGKVYFQNFLQKRMLKLLVPYFIALMMCFFVFLSIGILPSWPQLIEGLSKGFTFLPFSWYVIALILFTFAFYLVFSSCSSKVGVIVMTLFTVIYTCICRWLGFPFWWYTPIFCFPLGLFWANYESRIFALSKRYYYVILGILFFIFAAFALIVWLGWIPFEEGRAIEKIFVTPMLCVVVMFVIQKIKFSNKILEAISSFSFEMYLTHGMIIRLFRNAHIWIRSDFVYVATVISTVLIVSALLHRLIVIFFKSSFFKKATRAS